MRLSDIDKNVSRVTEGSLDNPGAEDSPVASAITRRILLQRTDLLAKYGPEKVGQAVDEVADFVGDVEEIGSSDVSGWIRHVEQMLGNMGEGVAEADKHYSNTKNPVDFPKTWHDVDKKLGKAVDKMSQAEKVKKGLAHPDTLKKKGVAEGGYPEVDHMPGKRGIGLGSAKPKDTYVATFHASKEKEAQEFAKKNGYIVKKHVYPKSANNSQPHEFQVHKNEQGVAESTEELYGLRVGDSVKAVVNGKRVQGDVIDIFPETMEVELLLRGANAGRTITVDVRDTEAVSEAFGSSSVDMTSAAGTDGHQQSIDFYNQEVDNLAGQADPEFQEWIEAAEEKLVAAVRAGKPFTHLAKVLSAQQVKKFGGKTLGQRYGSQMAGKADAFYTSEIRDIIAGPVTNAGNEMTRRHELSLQLQTIRSGWRRMSPEDKQNLADQVGYSVEELEHFVKTGQHPDEEDNLREMSISGNKSVKQVRPATPDELRTGYTASKSHAVGADGNVYYFMDPKLKQVGLLRNKQQGVTEVSKATLDQYVPKAVDAHGHADFSARMSKDDPTKRSYHVDQKRTAEKRRQGISRALDRMSKMEEGTSSVNVGDDVIITGAVKYKGATGVVDSVGRDGNFIVVNLYNHGKQSFQSTDVSPNDYAGSEAEESEMQRREMGESAPRSALGKAIKEGAKVDRMVKHITKSEKAAGKSAAEAEDIAWATANKRGMLDNKNKKTESTKARASKKY